MFAVLDNIGNAARAQWPNWKVPQKQAQTQLAGYVPWDMAAAATYVVFDFTVWTKIRTKHFEEKKIANKQTELGRPPYLVLHTSVI